MDAIRNLMSSVFERSAAIQRTELVETVRQLSFNWRLQRLITGTRLLVKLHEFEASFDILTLSRRAGGRDAIAATANEMLLVRRHVGACVHPPDR